MAAKLPVTALPSSTAHALVPPAAHQEFWAVYNTDNGREAARCATYGEAVIEQMRRDKIHTSVKS